MRILIQATRAVFVELLGVILVLWLLFGSVTWTLKSAGAQSETGRTGNLLAIFTSSVNVHLLRRPENAVSQNDEVAKRLDYYSRVYRRTATGYLRQVTENLTSDLSNRERPQEHAVREHENTL